MSNSGINTGAPNPALGWTAMPGAAPESSELPSPPSPLRPEINDPIVAIPDSTKTAQKVDKLNANLQAEIKALFATLQAEIKKKSTEAISKLNNKVQVQAPDVPDVPDVPDAADHVTMSPPTQEEHNPGPPEQQSAPAPVNVKPTPGKKTTMSEAISNAFSGRAGTIAGAMVFGLVAVSAITLMSAFPPILLFGALFGLAVAAEMAKPVREFQADLRKQREEEKLDSKLDEEEDVEVQEQPSPLPHVPTTPLPPPLPAVPTQPPHARPVNQPDKPIAMAQHHPS